jgi:hypothetical protein
MAVSAAPAQEKGCSLEAGVARVDITPQGPVYMAGYAARKTPSEGVDLPLQAKALALRDQRGNTILWITADIIGFDRPFTEKVVRRICEQHCLPRDAVALFASHTHTGPTLKVSAEGFKERDVDPESAAAKNNFAFRADLEEKLVRLAADALKKMAPAEAWFGVGRTTFAMNRREKTATGYKIGINPGGPTDKTVPVLRVAGAWGGPPIAIVVGYACHNTTLTEKAMRLSGDYAGFAQRRIEESHPDAVALFLTGCAGDANPEPRGTLDLAREHGRELADAVETTLEAPMTPLMGNLASAFTERTIHFAGPVDRAAYEARLKVPGSSRQAHARRIVAALESGKTIQADYAYPVQAFALGEKLTIVTLAGEVVADYAIRLRKELGTANERLWVAAYANDVFGYVGSARVIREGGYEGLESYYFSGFPTPLDEGVEEIVVGAAHDVVNAVRKRKAH